MWFSFAGKSLCSTILFSIVGSVCFNRLSIQVVSIVILLTASINFHIVQYCYQYCYCPVCRLSHGCLVPEPQCEQQQQPPRPPAARATRQAVAAARTARPGSQRSLRQVRARLRLGNLKSESDSDSLASSIKLLNDHPARGQAAGRAAARSGPSGRRCARCQRRPRELQVTSTRLGSC